MILLDLALQGIRDLGGSMRVRLQSGYNALVCPRVRSDTILLGVLELLYHDPGARADEPLAPAGVKSGGGLTLMQPDGSTFRVVRDLSAGTAQLLELDRGARAFRSLSSDPGEIARFLHGRVGLPSRTRFERAFVLRPEDLPAREAPPEVGVGAPAKPDRASREARIAELEEEIARHERVQALEYELDGLQKQRFELEDALAALRFDDTELREAEAQARRTTHLDILPEDFVARHEEYLRLKERREADLQRWEVEREPLERARRGAEVAPVLRDWRLWAGLAAGSAAVTAAFLLGGVFRYVAFLDIPAYGLAAFVLVQSLNQREERARLTRRLELSDRRREVVLARDEKIIADVEKLLHEADVSTPEEVRAALEMRAGVRSRRARLREAARVARQDPRLDELADRREQVMARIAALEEQLGDVSSTPPDLTALKAEAEALRAELGPPPEGGALELGEGGPMGAEFRQSAFDLLLMDPDGAARVLGERASLLLRALSDNRLAGVLFERDGSVHIRTAAGGAVAWAEMPPAAQNLAYLALRGGLVLALDQRARLPVLACDLAGDVAGGAEATQTLFSTLAQAGQLVHLVRRPDDAPQAKNVVDVGV